MTSVTRLANDSDTSEGWECVALGEGVGKGSRERDPEACTAGRERDPEVCTAGSIWTTSTSGGWVKKLIGFAAEGDGCGGQLPGGRRLRETVEGDG